MSARTKARDGIAEDLQLARSFASIAYHMREMVRVRSSLVRLAENAIWFSMRALRDDAVVHLWKVYDTQKSAHSLPWFVQNQSILGAEVQKEDARAIGMKNPLVRRLSILRHQLVAHRGSALATAGAQKVMKDNNLSEEEFASLVQQAAEVLARHSGEPLPRRIWHKPQFAVGELAELDMYLLDAIRGRWGGLERLEPMIDGDVAG